MGRFNEEDWKQTNKNESKQKWEKHKNVKNESKQKWEKHKNVRTKKRKRGKEQTTLLQVKIN